MSEARSDLQTIKDWFAAISTDDFFALPPRKGRSTASAGHEEADEILDEHDLEPGEASYVFWHAQSDRFTADGTLSGELLLHWGGAYEAVRAALAEPPAGFQVTEGGPDQAFGLRKQVSIEAGLPDPEADPAATLGAIDALGYLSAESDLRLADWLVRCVAASDPTMRWQAYRALHQVSPPQAIELLLPSWEQTLKKGVKHDLYFAVADFLRDLHTVDHPEFEQIRQRCARNRAKAFQEAGIAVLAHLPPTPERLAEAEAAVQAGMGVAKRAYQHQLQGAGELSELEAAQRLAARHLPDGEAPDAFELSQQLTAVVKAYAKQHELPSALRRDIGRVGLQMATDEALPEWLRMAAFAKAVSYLEFRDDQTDTRRQAYEVGQRTGYAPAAEHVDKLASWADLG